MTHNPEGWCARYDCQCKSYVSPRDPYHVGANFVEQDANPAPVAFHSCLQDFCVALYWILTVNELLDDDTRKRFRLLEVR